MSRQGRQLGVWVQEWLTTPRSYFLAFQLRKNKNRSLADVCLLSSKPATAFFLSQPQQLLYPSHLIKSTLPVNYAAHPEWTTVSMPTAAWMVPNPDGLISVPGPRTARTRVVALCQTQGQEWLQGPQRMLWSLGPGGQTHSTGCSPLWGTARLALPHQPFPWLKPPSLCFRADAVPFPFPDAPLIFKPVPSSSPPPSPAFLTCYKWRLWLPLNSHIYQTSSCQP